MVHRQSKAVEVYFYNVLKTERMGKYDEQNYYVTCGQFIFRILLIAVTLDTILGVLRAIKEHKFNSCVGIDGAIRKSAMLLSVCLLMAVDVILNINVLFMIPQNYIELLGIHKLGICEFFSILFVLYEIVSVLKNMTLCGLPVPAKIKRWVQKFLEDMTEELPEENRTGNA